MPLPFPGMDPYLEATANEWPGFHTVLLAELAVSLNRILPDGFRATCERRESFEIGVTGQTFSAIPDIAIQEPATPRVAPSVAVSSVATDEEIETIWSSDYARQKVVRVMSAGRRINCEIELLSPSNKRPGTGRTMYLRKKEATLLGDVSFVEIDLLIAGLRACDPPDVAHDRYGTDERTPYVVASYPSWTRHPVIRSFNRPVRLDQPLPVIRIPLTEAVGFVSVDLQACFTQVYDEHRYAAVLHNEETRPLVLPTPLDEQLAAILP